MGLRTHRDEHLQLLLMVDANEEPASVTVIVPTYNRSAFLPDVVASLKAQTHPSFHVVIVDDGSTDDTVAVTTDAIAGDPRFTLVSTVNRGPAAARNIGARDAASEWLAFTDDDCVPQPGWLSSLVEIARVAGADVIQGRTITDPAMRRAESPWFSRGKVINSWSGWFQTCNLAIRTSRFRDVGGFDESFPPRGFGEDTDVGLRVVRAGGVTAFAFQALVHHRLLPMTFLERLRHRYRWAQVVHLVAVNPDARAAFPHRYVAQRSHVAFWLVLPVAVAAMVVGQWWVPLAAVGGFVVQRSVATRREDRPLVVKMARAPLELVGVGVESVGFVIESVRNRSLLL